MKLEIRVFNGRREARGRQFQEMDSTSAPLRPQQHSQHNQRLTSPHAPLCPVDFFLIFPSLTPWTLLTFVNYSKSYCEQDKNQK